MRKTWYLSSLRETEPDLVNGLVHRIGDQEHDREDGVECRRLDDERGQGEVLLGMPGREVREMRPAVHEQSYQDEDCEYDV